MYFPPRATRLASGAITAEDAVTVRGLRAGPRPPPARSPVGGDFPLYHVLKYKVKNYFLALVAAFFFLGALSGPRVRFCPLLAGPSPTTDAFFAILSAITLPV